MAIQKRKKLTLDQVENQMEVLTKEEMDILKGGGDGTYGSPYTIDEFYFHLDTNSFSGGYVEGMGYVNFIEGVEVTGSYKNPLHRHMDQAKHTLDEWMERYKDHSWSELATEAGWHHLQPLGVDRDWRYIINPIDGNVMDMRHVIVVGYGYGEKIGSAIEFLQGTLPFTKSSADDPQDYYSNKIGAYFYQLRHSGKWSSDSWAYDFKRFIDTQYKVLFRDYGSN